MERGHEAKAIESVRRAVRECWSRGQPAIVSTHRANYVHLDAGRAAAGRGALRDLLRALVDDGASFLVDAEVRQIEERGWSVRDFGSRGVLLRYHGVPREPARFPARPGAERVAVREGKGPDAVEVTLEGGEVVARVNVGEYLFEWKAR
jgi:hypothetical protein